MKLSRYTMREKEMSLRTSAHAGVAIPRTFCRRAEASGSLPLTGGLSHR